MDIEQLRSYCLSKPETSEDFPFDEEVLVFRVLGKIYLLTNIMAEELTINLKCDPERAISLREKHEEIKPGYHMNKRHWNTVDCSGDLSADLIRDLVDHSYDMVVKGLPKKQQVLLQKR